MPPPSLRVARVRIGLYLIIYRVERAAGAPGAQLLLWEAQLGVCDVAWGCDVDSPAGSA